VPLNESWGVPSLEHSPAQQNYVRGLYHLTKALDPTRIVIGNDGWEHLASDIWGINDYSRDGATLLERYSTTEALERTFREIQPHYRTIVLPDYKRGHEPVMLTEFGGIGFTPAAGEHWYGYGAVNDEAGFIEKYGEVVGAILDSQPIAGFCYTQLTDTEQETNGLLRADRTPKVDVKAIRSITERASKSIPGDVHASFVLSMEVTAFEGTAS
jgi:hypothetical protein